MRIIFSVALLLISSVWTAAQSPQKVELELKDINGRSLRLADYKGKVLLINFWATWCIPCRSEIPDLVKWQRQYRAQGLRIIGITYPPESVSDVRRYMKRLKINYPVAIGTKDTKAKFTENQLLPITVVIDREGIIREVIEGIIFSDEFEQKVRPLIFSKRISVLKRFASKSSHSHRASARWKGTHIVGKPLKRFSVDALPFTGLKPGVNEKDF